MADMVNLQISSTISQFGSEKRFEKNILISALKGKLELITGVTSGWMEVELYNENNVLISKLTDDKMLGYYSPLDSWRIHVINKNPNTVAGEFDDLSKVEKYEMAEDEYDKKQDSVRNFMKRNKLGKFSEDAKNAEELALEKEKGEEERAKTFKVGDRCETSVPKQAKRRGVVMYIGSTEFKPGCWVGVKYDEPLGKNNGSVQDKRYFTCPPKYGGFVRPSQMEVGDFPEDDLGFDDDDEM